MDLNLPEITFPEAQRNLHVSRSTLFRYIKTGKISAWKVGHTWRLYSDDVKNFCKKFEIALPTEQQ